MLIALLNDLLTDSTRESLWSACNSDRWSFGHSSNSNAQQVTQSFWVMDLNGNEACDELWRVAKPKCEGVINKPLEVIRQYANGHTYGLGGQVHADDTRAGSYTLLYYPMPEWQQIWQGETVYFDENGEIKTAVQPKPNRGVFFDSRIPHVGHAPSRYFGGLRVTVALKLKIVDN
ncbi:MAG: 2OG-Fe(II) oxygenase [Pseudomonadota bacterium]